MKLSDLLSQDISSVSDIEIQGISDHIDHIKAGDLFLCIPGDRFDPVLMISKIERSGAAAILLPEDKRDMRTTLPCFFASDIRQAAAEIWNRFYGSPASKLRFIGITGTNGKTSTAKILSHMLTSAHISCGYIGTLGAEINGMPLIHYDADAMTTPPPHILYPLLAKFVSMGVDTVVMEVSSHGLMQKRIFPIRFHIGIFTNLTEDHLDYHGNMENYFQAKSILFEKCDLSLINLDDPYGKRLYRQLGKRKLGFGILEQADYRITNLHETGLKCTNYTCITPNGSFDVEYPLFGAFQVYNTLAALGCALSYDLCPEECRHALDTLPPLKGRLEIVNSVPFHVIIDYAHTPNAMEESIKAARSITRGRLITLFGAGGDREKEKRPIMGSIGERLSDFCIVTSDNCRSERNASIISDILAGMKKPEKRFVAVNRRQAIQKAINMAKPGDTILLLGKGHEEYEIHGNAKLPFSEREIVLSCLKDKENHT